MEGAEDCPIFIMKKVEDPFLYMKDKKALGLNSIPVKLYKLGVSPTARSIRG